MKIILLVFIVFTSIIGVASSCYEENVAPNENTENNNKTMSSKITIKVNSRSFTATLFDNNSAKAFKDMLPMTISMIELNANEKYYDLPSNLPTNSSNQGTIQSGDLMLYGSSTLVLFYKTFATSYSYTKLGRIDNPSGLTSALGSGNVTVTFEVP